MRIVQTVLQMVGSACVLGAVQAATCCRIARGAANSGGDKTSAGARLRHLLQEIGHVMAAAA